MSKEVWNPNVHARCLKTTAKIQKFPPMARNCYHFHQSKFPLQNPRFSMMAQQLCHPLPRRYSKYQVFPGYLDEFCSPEAASDQHFHAPLPNNEWERSNVPRTLCVGNDQEDYNVGYDRVWSLCLLTTCDSDCVNCTKIFGIEICPVNGSVETWDINDESLGLVTFIEGIMPFDRLLCSTQNGRSYGASQQAFADLLTSLG